jgi:hypothetical protein
MLLGFLMFVIIVPFSVSTHSQRSLLPIEAVDVLSNE